MGRDLDREKATRDLASWNWRDDPDHVLLKAIAVCGRDGVDLLMEERSRRTDQDVRGWFVQEIAHSENPEAIDALRTIARDTGRGMQDSRWMAIYGLTTILGPGATGDFEAALSDPSRSNRWNAAMWLARVGTEQAWWPALEQLKRVLMRPTKGGFTPPEVVSYVCYLGRFVEESCHKQKLVALLRKYWTKMKFADRLVLGRLWPGVEPDGPPAGELVSPDPGQLLIGVESTSYTWGPLKDLEGEALRLERLADPEYGFR